ncbi:hypothetical protein Lepto7375DRAFT_0445 [Leptolyngbya sp. PCC 7375]|nr:hypothetical protein Lepto7375DRAFT_0445 [Leptolyngbya sp. PCC 7375]
MPEILLIYPVPDEMAASGHHNHQAWPEAIHRLHNQWERLQQQIYRANKRAQKALESTWEHLTGQSPYG